MAELTYIMKKELKESIIKYCDVIKSCIDLELTIYLFGSIAKGKYFVNSDIDLLVQLKGIELSAKEKRDYRLLIAENTWDFSNYKELDCKVYGEIDFNKLTQYSYFEKSIKEDLIAVTDWR